MMTEFLTRKRGRGGWDVTDSLSYIYLILGTFIMFGPVLWLILSSFKTPQALVEFPPKFFPTTQQTIQVEGFDEPLLLFNVPMPDGTIQQLVRTRRVGLQWHFIDPANPADEPLVIDTREVPGIEEARSIELAVSNYTEPLGRFNFLRFLRNSVVVTVAATAITLIINSMAAFALSKYQFKGRNLIFVIIIATLMIPISVILVPVFLVIVEVGWKDNLLGVIIPGAATPTGVFLLRQYMLTIPDELIDSARIDGASEWRIYWQVILPLAAPAMAVLAIFSVMWRWNDFLWPLIVLSRNELFTLQLGLNSFQGELNIQWHFVLAMTVLTLLPITLVFAILQRFITTGIATTGMK